MKQIILLGAGGHAKVLLDILLQEGANVVGILDKEPVAGELYGVPILGNDEAIAAFSPEDTRLVNGLGSVGSVKLRRKLYEKFTAQGFGFRRVIHGGATVSPRARIGAGAQIMGGATVNIDAVIGEDAIINTGASVDHDTIIGEHTHIAPGATISGGVVIGAGSHIGAGATIIQGVTVGENVIVGAGSVVLRDIASGQTVWGVPAKTSRA